MSKPVFFILLFAITLSFSTFAFGQGGGALRNDLKDSFRKFDLIRINNQNAQRQVESNSGLSIQTPTKNFQFSLTPRDLRSPRYRAEDTTALGTRVLEKGAVVKTFKGKVIGDDSSEVRLTIDDGKIEGYFVSEGRRHFIEPANRHSKFAGKDDFIVYQEGDLLKNDPFSCHLDLGEKIERGKNYVFRKTLETPQAMKVIELATDADAEYVTGTGGANATNNEILNILNLVEGVYERELNLTFSVVFQHTWSSPDPFDATSANIFIVSFQNYWNANYENVARDAAYIWTGKPNLLNQGLSYTGVVCKRLDYAYGFNGRVQWNEAKFLVAAHEMGHSLNAKHTDGGSCASTVMNPIAYPSTALSFCSLSRSEISDHVASFGSCLDAQISAPTRFDFDNDGKSDISVFRPSNGVWYIANSGGGYNIFKFGQDGDLPVSADFDGDGKADAAVYRGGNWYRLKSSNGTFDGIGFGLPTDVPAGADFDGDGKTDVAVFRPENGTWYILNSSGGSLSAVQFGAAGDVPMPGDYDGDGKADINVFRPSNGTWYRLNSGNGSFYAVQFGAIGDKAVSGDFDGDGKTDVGVFRGSNGGWYVLKSSDGSLLAAAFGTFGDVPVASDYDGDGKTDISVFRPSGGNWYRLNSSNNSFAAVQFGVSSDIPVQSYYVK